jgi:hypothetical protein
LHDVCLPSEPNSITVNSEDTETEQPLKEQILIRLDPDAYARLERELTPPVVTNQTTDLMAGYQLGVQEVLKKLRSGYVIER